VMLKTPGECYAAYFVCRRWHAAGPCPPSGGCQVRWADQKLIIQQQQRGWQWRRQQCTGEQGRRICEAFTTR
jgi:hypothetical protein